MKKKESNSKITSSIIYNTIGSGVYLFIQWIIMYIVLWIGGYKQEGVFSTIVSVSAIFYAFSLFGMRNYQSTDLNNQHTEKTYIMSRFITCIVSLIIAVVYCLFLKYNFYVILCVISYMLFKFSESFIDVIHGSLQKQWLFKNIGISFILRSLISFVSFLGTYLLYKNLLISIITMAIFCLLIVYFYDYKLYRKSINEFGSTSYSNIKKLLITCLPLAIYTLLSNYALSYPKIAIGRVLGDTILGYYTTYANLAMMVQVTAGIITSPLITYFAELYQEEDKTKLIRSINKSILIVMAMGTLILLCSFCFGKLIFKLLFGKEILTYYYLLNPVIIISLFTALLWLLAAVVIIMRKFKILIVTNFIYCFMIIVFSNRVLKMGLNYMNFYIIFLMFLILVIYYINIRLYLIKNNNKNRRL